MNSVLAYKMIFAVLDHSSKIRFFTFFFDNPKTRLLRFFEVAFQKQRKNVIQKIQVSEYVQHYVTRKPS